MTKAFRAELAKLMPGYSWTIHKSSAPEVYIEATGTQSKGSNRLSTLYVSRHAGSGVATYTVKSAGYGLRAKWLHEASDGTLARALRGLQDYYTAMEVEYRSHASALAIGRKPKDAK